MTRALRELRPARVIGIGLHPYQRRSETPYVALGLRAVREALADAGIGWRDVDAAYTGTALLGMAPTRVMLRHLGATGIPVLQVENASASGSSAVAQACLAVASGVSEVALALGVDKPAPLPLAASKAGVRDLAGSRVVPFTHFALLARETCAQAYEEAGVGAGDLDLVELHDAFTVEELLYTEAMGLCGPGEGAALLARGETDVGGRCAVSASGGLLSMGHPIGPTGVGQICELTRQLRGEAGVRQQPSARLGMAHMVGVGAVCVVHVLEGS